MEQPVPDISELEVQRLIQRDFSLSEQATVEHMLHTYKAETPIGVNRVAVSILKLANGNLELVRDYVTIAKIVPRIKEQVNNRRHEYNEQQVRAR